MDPTPPAGPVAPLPGPLEKIRRNPLGQLLAYRKNQAEPVTDVRVARCFPWSLPDQYISVCDKDGKEMALLKTSADLDAESLDVIEQELRDKVFIPRIRRILDHKREFGVTSVTAETDRGRVTFQILTRDDIRVLSPTRALFRDADGNVYDLADIAQLDAASRAFLQEYF